MKTVIALGTSLIIYSMLACSSAVAQKANGPKARLFAKYDTNSNSVIDGKEKDALRKDFAADKEGPLKRYDANKDGKLDDEEIAAIKPAGSKKKSGTDQSGKEEGKAGKESEKKDAAGKAEK